jgi:hypothetical protein
MHDSLVFPKRHREAVKRIMEEEFLHDAGRLIIV